MSAFNKIKLGLEELIVYEKGELPTKVTKLSIAPVEKMRRTKLSALGDSKGLTLRPFAKYMGVSIKAIEAWESGRNHQEGSACRLLSLTKVDPLFPQKAGIVIK